MSSKINLQTCEYARKSSIFQDNQLILYKRDNICDYTVCFQSGYQLYMQTQDSGFNAYVRRGEHDQLQVTLGQYYPDLKWGNYLGKPLLPNRKLHFSICLKEGRESL